ncbi:hypothetical protein [Virgibacillus proomii]|uniref:hypothetical protein n=1 Tax=Virgibacillus proomii TaxID=84407 RepID=UPI0009841D3B|nr:hypothetical protein [Virgibacillus proomii]
MHPQNSRQALPKQDIQLLYQLYKYRALSTVQVAKVMNYSIWTVYKKISQLRGQGYLYSEHIKGNYILNQARQGNYHRISGKGISLLNLYGYKVDYTAEELKISVYRVAYLLTVNDLIIPLAQKGWGYQDSRATKNLLSLNRGDIVQGMLTSPDEGKEYALYIILKKARKDTLVRLKQEIIRLPLERILVIARGIDSFTSIVDSFMDKDKLIKGEAVKVLPLKIALAHLAISDGDEENYKRYIESLGITILGDSSNKNEFESNVHFDYLIECNGEEMYLMDLLGNDLMKIDELRHYRKEEYERDGRKVLVLTSGAEFHKDLHQQLLGHMNHVEYLFVNLNETIAFANDLSNKNVFGERVKEVLKRNRN